MPVDSACPGNAHDRRLTLFAPRVPLIGVRTWGENRNSWFHFSTHNGIRRSISPDSRPELFPARPSRNRQVHLAARPAPRRPVSGPSRSGAASQSERPSRASLRELLAGSPGKGTVVIDEIQRVPELLTVIRAIAEEPSPPRFVLAGSSARKLRRGGVDLLGGRAVHRTMHPFMASELPEFDLDRALRIGLLPLVMDATDPTPGGRRRGRGGSSSRHGIVVVDDRVDDGFVHDVESAGGNGCPSSVCCAWRPTRCPGDRKRAGGTRAVASASRLGRSLGMRHTTSTLPAVSTSRSSQRSNAILPLPQGARQHRAPRRPSVRPDVGEQPHQLVLFGSPAGQKGRQRPPAGDEGIDGRLRGHGRNDSRRETSGAATPEKCRRARPLRHPVRRGPPCRFAASRHLPSAGSVHDSALHTLGTSFVSAIKPAPAYSNRSVCRSCRGDAYSLAGGERTGVE